MVRPHRGPQAPPKNEATDGLLPALDRLLQILRDENEQIGNRRLVDYRDMNAKKAQSLLELTRLRPALLCARDRPAVVGRLTEVVTALERNKYMLGVQVKAARKVSELIARAIADGQSDGTYSESSWRYDEEC
jgi:hypothetical protein